MPSVNANKNQAGRPTPKTRRPRSTLLQIAQACDISIATVSRVLNEPHIVKADTRKHVLAALREAGYYNRLAHLNALEAGQRPALGMIASRPADPLFLHSVSILEYAAQQNGYDLHLAFSGLEPEREFALLQRFQSYGISAIALFMSSSACEESLAKLRGETPHCLFLWDRPKDKRFSYIGIDTTQMTINAMRYLLSLGHRRIGLVVSLYKEGQRHSERIEGYAEALKGYGVSFDPDLISPLPNDPNLTTEPQDIGRIATNKLLLLPRRPTAILYVSDALAMGGLIAAQNAGLSVPDQISVMGMCDSAISPHTRPPLTTIRPPFEEASRLVGSFFEQVSKKALHAPCQHLLETELVIRSSCTNPLVK